MMGALQCPKGVQLLEVKLRVVKRCLQNETNPSYEAKQLGIDKNTVTDWVRKYKADGLDGLKESRGCKALLTEDLQLAAIRDVLSGSHSIREATKKYHISSKSVLTRWIPSILIVEIKSTRKVSRMNKGRKTTFEERIEIVHSIRSQTILDYQKSMEKYDVSYSQVYAWVRKYKSGGEEASRTVWS
ncbi:helix-turn-helix domain-containing protein [Paenibacillus larvae]|uniref:helix-turn-helix domain-containing protein n=1 Tax=Paenibacillus larvae TaxID=1464 RepID=UPI00288FEF45|nr:helix-turn-helix domain-containing protein [Paenibacillus larvae]MDT2194672.1 helix-turn-helix domain-containing protein [Paenibacillus larvae]